MTQAEKTTIRAQMACAKWLKACVDLGWPKESLDMLEALWWRYHDHTGALRSAL